MRHPSVFQLKPYLIENTKAYSKAAKPGYCSCKELEE